MGLWITVYAEMNRNKVRSTAQDVWRNVCRRQSSNQHPTLNTSVNGFSKPQKDLIKFSEQNIAELNSKPSVGCELAELLWPMTFTLATSWAPYVANNRDWRPVTVSFLFFSKKKCRAIAADWWWTFSRRDNCALGRESTTTVFGSWSCSPCKRF